MSTEHTAAPAIADMSEQMQIRLEKRAKLIESGREAYPVGLLDSEGNRVEPNHIEDLRAEYDPKLESGELKAGDETERVVHVGGRVVFVRFALPGELVRIELDEPHDRDDRFWTGEVIEVLEASEDRVDPAWSLAGPLAMGGGVGGADLVHVSLPGQLKWKAVTVSEQMSRLGHIDLGVAI